MRGIAGLLRSLFNTHGEAVDYKQACEAAEAAGFSLNEGTFRTNKSLWKRDQRLLSVGASVSVVSAPVVEAPVVAPVAEEQPLDGQAIPEYTFDAEFTDEMKEHFVPPKVDASHVINEELRTLFDSIHKASFNRPQNVRLSGPAGCGKTTTAMEFAARYGRPMLVMDCANIREPRDWFGYKTIDPKTGSVVWKKSLFLRFVQVSGAVIVLDEINRVNPMVINTLLPLLDDRRATYLEEADSKIKVGSNVVFFATTNEGREFTGTVSLDFANADRLSTLIEVNYLPEEEESKLLHARTKLDLDSCKKLCAVAATVRKKAASDSADSFSKGISTRILLNAAEKMHLSGPKTLRYTLLSHFSQEGGEQSERGQLFKLLTGKFGPVI